MRRILNFPGNGKAPTALAAALAVTLFIGASLQAQSPVRQQLAPTAMNLQDTPVSAAIAYDTASGAARDAGYSIVGDLSEVQQAGHFGRRSSLYDIPFQHPCDPGCDVRGYVTVEALAFERTGDKYFSLSRNTFLPETDFELGGRYTFGALSNCTNGYEFSYVGPFTWERDLTVGGAGNLQSQLFATGGYAPGDISAFNDADFHVQTFRARMESFEFNQKWWVWDVLSTMVGVRFIDYEEDFAFFSTGAANGSGLMTERLDNQMIGAQLGGEMYYPVTLRSNIGVRGKGGVYANFEERRAFLNNNGNVLINAGDSQVDVAGQFEAGVLFNYHFTRSIRVTAGYEFWWLAGVATVDEQQPSIISPATGTGISNEDDVFLHGASLGAQVVF